PLSRNEWSTSRALSTSSRDPGSCLISAASSGGNSYRSFSSGFPGSILLAMPSRPAITQAANDRYGLHVGSGVLNSMRLAFSDFEYIGIRIAADRFRLL